MKLAAQALTGLWLVVASAGCSSVTSAEVALEGSAWVLESLPGRPWNGTPATARFDSGRISGTDGCNRYSAAFSTKGSTLEIGPRGASTQMACPPDVMKQAEAFIAALNGTKSYRVEGGRLSLLSADGVTLAMFAPQSTSLAGTSWKVTGINNGRQALVSVPGGTSVTMAFAADNRASGSAGCNQFNAGYEADGTRFRFVAPAATRRMCPGEGVMEQEQHFLKALEAVTTVRIEGNRLEFRDAGGAMQVTASRE